MNPEVDLDFWREWMLAVAGIKGEIEILPETLNRWKKEVDEFKKKEARKYEIH